MKKIIALISFMILVFSISITHAQGNDRKTLMKKIILTKSKAKKEVKNGTKYLGIFDKYLKKYENSPEKLNTLSERIEEAQNRVENSSKISESKKQQYLLIFNYFIYRAELISLENNTENDEVEYIVAPRSKITSDIRTLTSAIEIGVSKGSFGLKDVIENENSKFKNKDLDHIVYKVGNINFELIAQNREYFKSGNDFKYQIAYIKIKEGNKEKEYYQLLGLMHEKNGSSQYTTVIKGNYFNYNTYGPQSLFVHPDNQEVLESGKIYNFKDYVYRASIKQKNISSLEQSKLDARNSKVKSDLRTLASAIEIGVTKGNFTMRDLVIENSEEFKNSNIVDIYRVGKINLNIMGLNSDSFNSPNDFEYKIAYLERSEGEREYNYYQLLGFTETTVGSNVYKTEIKGNYFNNSSGDPISLFVHPDTGEVLDFRKEYELK